MLNPEGKKWLLYTNNESSVVVKFDIYGQYEGLGHVPGTYNPQLRPFFVINLMNIVYTYSYSNSPINVVTHSPWLV